MDRTGLERKALVELREIAAAMELKGYQRLKKADLVDLIIDSGGGSSNGKAKGNGKKDSEDRDTDTSSDRKGKDEAESKRDDGSHGEGDDDAGDDVQRERTRSRGGKGDDDADSDDDDDDGRSEHDDGGNGGDDDTNRGDDDGGNRGDDDGGNPSDDDGGNRNRNKRNRNKRNRNRSKGGGQQQQQEDLSDAEVREGVLDLLPEGYGFLRVTGYLAGDRDVYVSQSFVRRYNLRRGDLIKGPIRRNKNSDKFPALARVDQIEGDEAKDGGGKRVDFNKLTPLFPRERFLLETEDASPVSMRLVDMMSPIGKGQRGLIVSPPKAGKTTILKQLAHAIETNSPETHLMVLLVDERPEEVTDFQRSTKGEVIASTFDRPADDHTQVAELCIERAKRLVERGRDVVILLDSITRLGRAYNLAAPASGRILSGGIDSAALYPPKRFFGAARNIEEGGSLTIIATALVETGSKMDEVIFEEFKGTGNMELRLDRKLEQKRIFPAIDVAASGTRKEELLLEKDDLDAVWKLRRVVASLEGGAALELLIDKIKATRNNDQFLQMIAKSNLNV
ncbi:MAG: transcription termination factor Rho [Actinobacteria bacterium]|nr:transcription termination factor Rho [Actinomycetota bacterium]